MKRIICLISFYSTLCGMDIPQRNFDHAGTPPSSPQWHSAPASPQSGRRYGRDLLMAIGQAHKNGLTKSGDSFMVDLIGKKYSPETKELFQVKEHGKK